MTPLVLAAAVVLLAAATIAAGSRLGTWDPDR